MGGSSDLVRGLGLGTPDEPQSKRAGAFGLVFVEQTDVAPPQPPKKDDEREDDKTDDQGDVTPPVPPKKEEEEGEDQTTDQSGDDGGQGTVTVEADVDEDVQRFLDMGLIRLDQDGDTFKIEKMIWFPKKVDKPFLFVDVVDCSGERMVGQEVRVWWTGGEARIPLEEKPGEEWGTSLRMQHTLGNYHVEVSSEEGSSDKAHDLGLGTHEQPDFTIHTGFGIRFRKVKDCEE
jgi:hypothetical protein